MKPLTAFMVALNLLAASPVLAQHQKFAIDPNASDVKITLKTTHEIVNGTFHVDSGSIDYDRTESRFPAPSSLRLVAARPAMTAGIRR